MNGGFGSALAVSPHRDMLRRAFLQLIHHRRDPRVEPLEPLPRGADDQQILELIGVLNDYRRCRK